MIDLYTWTTPNGRKASVALEELGLPYRVHAVDIGKGAQDTPDFRRINPNGKIPAIVDDELLDESNRPTAIFESGAVLVYLAEKTGRLLARSGAERARTLEWTFWQMGGTGPMLGQWHHFDSLKQPEPYATMRYLDESLRLLGVLDGHLQDREFIAAEFSIADIANYPWAKGGLDLIAKKHPHVNGRFKAMEAWIGRLDQRPGVQAGMKVPQTGR